VSTPSEPGSGEQPDPWQAPPAGSSGAGEPPPPPYGQPSYGQPAPPPPAFGQPAPPPPGYGQPAYGQPAPPAYGQAPYGQAPYGQAPYGQAPYGYPQAPPSAYANWGLRVGANLIDYSGLAIVAAIFLVAHVYAIGYLVDLIAIVWGLYNAYQAGATGQSFGKKTVGTRLVNVNTGGVIGGGAGIGRYFLHILDALPCYLGFLWPLWDAKRQTFADKIIGSVVVKA
jgi:uncharacterized RDD family membrane protein YckC